MIRRRPLAAGTAAAALLGAPPARAAWPERPVTVIVPYPPGGNNDILARLLGPVVERAIGTTLVVDNRGGAGGTIGAGAAARAAPDGHTALFGDVGILAINPHLYARLPYDPAAFEPVIRLTEVSLILAVPPNSPHRTVADLLSAARARPDGLSFATAGSGSAQHLATQLLMSRAGIRMTHVPYRGSAPAVTDLTNGTVDLMIDGTVLPHVTDGRLRGLAVTGPSRSPLSPSLPTLAESGVPDYAFLSWHGVLLPRGAPAEAVTRLNAAYNAAIRDPEVQSRARTLGLPLKGGSPAEFAAFIASERERLGPVVAATGARVE